VTGAKYHKVFTRLWSSPGFRAAGDDERLATVYVLTCRHRNTEGLFVLPMPLAAHELVWSVERTGEAFEALEVSGFVAVDPTVDLVWLVNAVEWNTPVGEKQLRGAVNVLAETPESFLQAHYLLRCREVCPDLAALITSDLKWSDTPSIPLRYPSGITIRISSSISSSNSSSSSSSSAPPNETNRDVEPAVAELVELVELADDLIETLGVVGAVANQGERKLVQRALNRGWTKTDLLDEACDIAGRDDIDSPRRYLNAVLRRLANTNPPTTTKNHPEPPRGLLDDQRTPCTTCHATAWVDNDDGTVTRCTDCTTTGIAGAPAGTLPPPHSGGVDATARAAARTELEAGLKRAREDTR
jgi:hypothetical protein